ncbi:MAG: SpoIIE family protein phosphatase [Magnetospirillum sp. WYHS-4]
MTFDLPTLLAVGTDIPAPFRGLPATLAESLDEAIAQATVGGFAVVVADATGLTPLAHAVAKLAEAAPDAAVIVWTVRSGEAEALRALAFGATDFLLAEETGILDAAAFLLGAAGHRRAVRRRQNRTKALGVLPAGPGGFLWEADAHSRFVWFSDGLRGRTDLDAARALGRTFWDLDLFEQPADFWSRLRADISGGRSFRDLLFGLPTRTGGPAALRIEGEARFGPDGTLLGYAGTGTDVTHEVRHSLRLAQVHERLMDTHESLEDFRVRVEEDLRAARVMQEEMLPTPEEIQAVEERYGVAIEAHFETSSELGGDIWGLKPIDDRRFALYMADFSGHGVTAALNTFRLHTVLDTLAADLDKPGDYLQALNRRMAALLPTGQYATMFYGVIDVAEETLCYAAAAAPRPLLADPASGAVRAIDGSGLPVGVTKNVRYETRRVPFPDGGLLFLYSDALLECGREKGRALGRQGVVDLVRDAVRDHGVRVPLQTLLAPFFAGVDRPLSDDLTAVRCLRKRHG